MSNNTIQSPLLGTNFYTQLILLLGSLFGMTQDTATLIVSTIAGIIAAVMAVRGWIVNAKFGGFGGWLKDPNTWAYLTTVIIALVPAAAELIPALHNLTDALFAGNLSGIITAAFSLVTMIYYTFIKKKAPASVQISGH